MKTSSSRPAPAASEAPASTKEMPAASSFPKGKEIPSTAASSPSAPGEHVSITTFLFLMMTLPLPAPESMFGCLQSNVDSKEVFV
jgi:hypothetical protein